MERVHQAQARAEQMDITKVTKKKKQELLSLARAHTHRRTDAHHTHNTHSLSLTHSHYTLILDKFDFFLKYIRANCQRRIASPSKRTGKGRPHTLVA
jgi:hypothetical protein